MTGRTDRVFFMITVLALLFLALPLLVVVPVGFSSANYLIFPPPGFSTQWFEKFLVTSSWTSALLTSLVVATLASLLATTLGTLCALALDGITFRGKGLLIIVLISPLIIPVVVIGIATYSAFTSIGLHGSIPALVLAHALLGLPFVLLTVSAALSQFDIRLRSAAQSLGATPTRAFFEVTLPLIAPGVISGAVLAFIVSFDDVTIATFLAGQRTETLPMRMVSALRFEFDPTVAAVATVLLGLAVAIFTTLRVLERTQRRVAREQ